MQMFNQEIEQLPLEKLRKLQNERLEQLIGRVYHNVPFYKKSIYENGLKPSDIQTVGDLHKIPFTRKNDLRDQYPFGLFAEPMEKILRIHASSGTTGKPTVVGYNRNDLEVFDEVVTRSLACAGAKPA
jgi:phenylacetate-CoA ligase